MNDRIKSALLLLLVCLCLCYGSWLVYCGLHDPKMALPWKSVGIICGAFWVAWLATAFRREHGDRLLLPLAAALCSISWVELYRLVPYIDHPNVDTRQAIWIAVGVLVYLVVVYGLSDYRVLEDYKYLFLFGGVAFQMTVMLFGTEVNGAKLWFRFNGMSFQPVEVVKIFLVIFLAAYLRQFRHWIRLGIVSPEGRLPRKALCLLGLGMAIAEGVLVMQKDLGMALLLFGLFVAMFYVATGRRDLISIAAVLSSVGAYYCYKWFKHVQVRVASWLDPFADADLTGYQMCQAIYALANGGIDGTGLALGRPFLVPEAETDFIFVSVAEELGMLGAIAVLLILAMLVMRCFLTSMLVNDEFGTLLAAGFATLFAWQTLIIVLGTTKMMPMTGITVPFMSYGGTSLVSNFAILGIMWRVSAAQEERYGA